MSSSLRSVVLTHALWQQVLDELGVIPHVQHAVDVGVHQLLLLVVQILTHVLRDKHYVALHVDHEEEAVQGLGGGGEKVEGQGQGGGEQRRQRRE